MPEVAVSTAFTAKDKVSPAFKRMTKASGIFGDKSSKAFNKASKAGSNFGSITKGILAAGAVQKGLGLLQQGIGGAASEFVQFDDAITASSAKFKGLNLATEQGQKTLLELKKTAREVGAATQFSATEAAQGLDFLAMAGFNASQAMSSLPGVVNLATVANVDLARATDIASDSLGAFGLMTEDNIQLQKNLTRINDVMAKTMTRTNTGLEELFEAAKKGAPTFTSTGQSIESFNALLGVMANSGVKGEEAGTQLRNVMLRLADPTSKAALIIEQLGVKVKDQQGNFRDVMDILGDFEKGLKGMGDQQRAAALSTVFGTRAITGVNILLAEGTDKLKAFRSELQNSAGSSTEMAAIMRQSLGNRLKSLQSALIETGFRFFTAFEKQGAGAIEMLTTAVRNFDMKPIIETVKTVITVVSTLYNILEPILPFATALGAAFLAYSTALKVVTIAQAAFNAVMLANPIVLAIVAITALIAAGYQLVKHWDTVKAAFIDLVTAIGAGLEKVWNWFNGMLDNPFFAAMGTLFAPILTVPALIIKHWEPIMSMFNNLGRNFKKLGRFFGFGGADETAAAAAPAQAPNQTEVQGRQQIGFNGRLQIAGAPEGSTVESETTGGAPMDVELMGVNL